MNKITGLLILALALACQSGWANTKDPYTDSFIAFYPLYEMARLRFVTIEEQSNPRRHDLHSFKHLRRLLDHTDRTVTAPNNDTLYSSARLDLRLGPVVIETPGIRDRYYSLQFMNFYTDNVAILGKRANGEGPMKIAVIGPGWKGSMPEHTHTVISDTNDMWLLIRILVDGPADISAVAQIQNAFRINAPGRPEAYPKQLLNPPKHPSPEQFLAVVNEFLERNPAKGKMADHLKTANGFGLRAGKKNAWPDLPEAVRANWQQKWAIAWTALNQASTLRAKIVQGWEYPPSEVGQWNDNYLLRATVALRGIAALDPSEALYLSTFVDINGEQLIGSKKYRLRIPPGGLPVGGFWSVTMYEVLEDGRFFLTENSLNRYSVGNRTTGLSANADGAIDIDVQHAEPANKSNWLPAPKGQFRLTLRAYLPATQLVDAAIALPRVEFTE